MNAMPFLLGALCAMAIAYRYYSAFLAAKVVALDGRRTPAHRLRDGQNYHPTNRWVLFGHHFAAISGAGPLIGPVLAAQFGFLPGFLWLLIGVCLAGAVQDFMILAASVRRDGRSLGELARFEISPLAGVTASLAILLIVVMALAGLGLAVVGSLRESAWGVFTIGATIPIALLVGLWMYKLRPGRIGEASLLGAVAVFAAVFLGHLVPGSPLAPWCTLSKSGVVTAIALYGFVASVLPVWLLLAPRDYLSAYVKIGTVAALVLGVVLVAPDLHMPAVSAFAAGGGPIFQGKLFPYVFVTIACGAISGFHALVGSGTTPKMLERETDARFIGYGAMLMEGLVGIIALIAACSLYPADYFAINVAPEKFAALGFVPVNLASLSAEVGERIAGRTGGAVSLAVGFAQIFSALPGMRGLMSYWYHFAIMFEALFILTTIDAGTRVARFLVQELAGRVWKPLGRADWWPGAIVSTALVVGAWAWFIVTGNISTVWPMFGTANQLLAAVALAVATSAILNAGKARYAWTTALPLAFVTTTTLTACVDNIRDIFLPQAVTDPRGGYLNCALTVLIMSGAVLVLAEAVRRWIRVLRPAAAPSRPRGRAAAVLAPPDYGCA